MNYTRALDRVLLFNYYLIPQFHIGHYRVAYWNKFSRPSISPKYDLGFDFWWFDEEKKMKIGNGKIKINNGELLFNIKKSKLKTGPKDLYETANLKINSNGEINGTIKLDILMGKDRSEIYNFNGKINEKIFGISPEETYLKTYLEIKK